jgi:hypothetical protein
VASAAVQRLHAVCATYIYVCATVDTMMQWTTSKVPNWPKLAWTQQSAGYQWLFCIAARTV